MGVSGQNKHSGTKTATKYHAGAQQMAYFCGLWAARYQIWATNGPKAPFFTPIYPYVTVPYLQVGLRLKHQQWRSLWKQCTVPCV